jgi:hypothetical protein
MILKRTPITAEELARVEAVCKANDFEIQVSPRSSADQPLARYLDEGPYGARVAGAADNLAPPTDDRPFFFYFKKPGDLLRPTGLMNDPGLWILISLGSVVVLAIAFVVAPLVIHWQRRAVGATGRHHAAVLTYFGLVGFAFMIVEIALLQRFTLFLGHPSYSLVVILFSLLVSTAAGAYLSSRIAPAALGRVLWIAGAVLAGLAALGGFVLPPVLHALIGLSLPARALTTVVLVAPTGIVMGVMIPSIVRILGAVGSPLVPWGWGVNGATSVIGTVVATVIAIYGGFTATFLVGAIGYLAAGLLGARLAVRLTPAAARTSETPDTAPSP